MLWNSIMQWIRRGAERCVWWLMMALCRRKLPRHMQSFSGVAHLPLDRGFMLVANHQSYFDSIMIYGVLWMLLGRRPRIPTKVKAFRGFWRSVFHHAFGAVPIDQAQPERTYAQLRELLQRGEILLMFPEGERSPDGQPLPFRYGAFNLAVELDVPIVPVAIRNAAGVLPKGSLRFVRGQVASLVFCAPVWPRAMSCHEPASAIARRLCERVKATITELVTCPQEPASMTEDDRRAIADAIEARVEKLLDVGLERIRPRQASELIAACRALRTWCHAYGPLEVQYLRVVGFWIVSLVKPLSALFIWPYWRKLQAMLAREPRQPYLNYFAGQLHSRTALLFGAPAHQRAAAAFGRAYDNARDHGFDPARFAMSYADSLAASGRVTEAMLLLRTHYPEAARGESLRLWRRRVRSESLMVELAYKITAQ